MTDEHQPGPERRRSPRVAMPPTGGPVSVVGGRLINVSAHGMMIESPVPLEVEAVLDFRLRVAGENWDVRCRVAGCHRLDLGSRYYGVGMEFVQLPAGGHERMAALLEDYEARAAER
jgi:hypothetical protein